MTKTLKMLVAQLNPVVGDIKGNKALAETAHAEAKAKRADLLVLSELFILGYPAEDLVLKPAAVEHSMAAIEALKALTKDGPSMLIGTPWAAEDKLFNSVVLLEQGEIRLRYDKRELPNYGVFDEKRIFDAGKGDHVLVEMNGIQVGIAICEDIWYSRVPAALHEAGAEVLLVPNASPWRRTVNEERHSTFSAWAKTGVPYLFANQAGGQDELVFDGASYAVDFDGAEHQLLGDFVTGTALVTYEGESHRFAPADDPAKLTSGWEAEYRAATLALGDYVNKNRFPGVVLGLSGGIDSALTAAMAVDALGPDRVWCVMMPSKYTSSDSLEDAKACAEALGVRYDTINIAPGVGALDEMLGEAFAETQADTTEENIQSRLRGLTLMALSNKFGLIVVTTGYMSEMAVGYATLYGDMCGGYNALKDFYKTEVFALSRWRNTGVPLGALGPSGEVIPERIITKPPSAELREDQKDSDSLPDYPDLDAMLEILVDRNGSIADCVAAGFDGDVARKIERSIYLSEYKRFQSAPGARLTKGAFWLDRRYPIVNGWRDPT